MQQGYYPTKYNPTESENRSYALASRAGLSASRLLNASKKGIYIYVYRDVYIYNYICFCVNGLGPFVCLAALHLNKSCNIKGHRIIAVNLRKGIAL